MNLLIKTQTKKNVKGKTQPTNKNRKAIRWQEVSKAEVYTV